MVDSVEETETLENEDINNEPQSGKAKTSPTPGNPAARAGGSSYLVVFFPQFLEVDHLLLHLQQTLIGFLSITSGMLDARTV